MNNNSFAENINTVVKQQANALQMLAALQKSLATNDANVSYTHVTDKNENVEITLPSYSSIINRLEAVENSITALHKGEGTITVSDTSGVTTREVKLVSIAEPPERITSPVNPETFEIDANWFFEDLMFPGAKVTIDLTNKIESTADRVKVKRIILNSQVANATTAWMNDLKDASYDYQQLVSYLTNNNIEYSEDEEILDLPMTRRTGEGFFQLTADPIYDDGEIWYQLDTLNYATVTSYGVNTGVNRVLSVEDYVSSNNTLFQIVEINQAAKRVRLKPVIGSNPIGRYSMLRYYEAPFATKEVKIRFGAHEYDIIYFKGIAEAFNLEASEWSEPVKFSTDELVYDGDGKTNFAQYYLNNIVDWGANMIAEAKEKPIKAYYGQTPNAPVLNESDFRVVQINTQINAALDTSEIKNLTADIENVKSQISSLKSTIAAQKTNLQTIQDYDSYKTLQLQIETNIKDLETAQLQFHTMVQQLQSYVKENGAVNVTPKYHIRGFFAIPELKYSDEDKTQPQQIIGFEIAYRYVKQDNTGVDLNTFTYTDTQSASTTGIFSDWNIVSGVTRERSYNETTGLYEWTSENVAAGDEININQVSIPITKGEKVEFRVRSVSEAGWPSNCLKSNWSNAIIIEFPSTLSTTNEIADLIKETNDEAIDLSIEYTLNSLGVNAHLNDTIQNTNSVNGLYYKHLAKNIAFELKDENDGTVKTVSLQEYLDNKFAEITSAIAALKK